MANIILHIGSNEGDRIHHLQAACNQLQLQLGDIIKESSIYETAAWGIEDQASFLNQAFWFETILPADEVLETTMQIEQSLGRLRHKKWTSRTIDIDIILYDDLILSTPKLIIPHPMIAQRRFVLQPLAEIIPEWVHPVYEKTILQLFEECDDGLEVTKWPSS